MPKRKEALVFERERGNKLYLVAVMLKHSKGALADVATRLEEAGFDLLSGFIGSTDDEKYSRCSWFMEATAGRPSKEEVKLLLERSPYCSKVEVKEAHSAVLVDSLNFPLTWGTGGRVIMLRTHFFDVMEQAIRALLSSGADVLLYQMGLNHGRPSWTDLLSSYKVKTKEDLAEIAQIYSATGWGRIEVLEFAPGSSRAVVRFSEGFESMNRSSEGRTGCNFTRGHLAGFFSVVFGDEKVGVTETKCRLRGDPECEFAASA